MSKLTRPLLRYHGGKWKVAPWIISYFPEHRTYVEPFGGGASVLLQKPKCYAEVYNDLDSEIVNLFKVVRTQGNKLIEKLELTPFARDEYLKAINKPKGSSLEKARYTIIKSFMGFSNAAITKRNTGFRANSNRSGTTPAHDWKNYPYALGSIIDRLRDVVIENRDAIDVMRQHDAKTTLHYVDPPYLPETRSTLNAYRYELTKDQHIELAEFLNQLKGMVILSGYHSSLYDELYQGWDRAERKSHTNNNLERTEVIWMKNIPGRLL